MLTLAEARADEPAAPPAVTCEASFEAAEMRLRPSESRLLDARVALRRCALPTCKAWMVDSCSNRLAEVEGRIPSIAFSAEDAHGAPLHDVRILEAGRELASRLDGVALEMDPGPHDLVAERDGMTVAHSVVLIKGKKAQQLLFTFSSVSPSPAGPAPGVVAPTTDPRRDTPSLAYPWARPFGGGLLVGAALALGTGAVLGLVAISNKHDARCDAANVCDAEPLANARRDARSATVAFGLGGALALAGGITLLVFGRTRVQTTASFQRLLLTTVW